MRGSEDTVKPGPYIHGRSRSLVSGRTHDTRQFSSLLVMNIRNCVPSCFSSLNSSLSPRTRSKIVSSLFQQVLALHKRHKHGVLSTHTQASPRGFPSSCNLDPLQNRLSSPLVSASLPRPLGPTFTTRSSWRGLTRRGEKLPR